MQQLTTDDKVKLQNMVGQYGPVSKESLDLLMQLGKVRLARKGDYLIHMGQVARRIYITLEGILVSQYPSGEGNIHLKNFFLQGSFAGSMVSSLKQEPSQFSVQCLEDARVIEMDFLKYKELILSKEDLMKFYINYLEKKWVVENEKRQMDFATASATDRYLTFLKEYPGLEDRVSQRQIALYLSITPTQLSRVRKELKKV